MKEITLETLRNAEWVRDDDITIVRYITILGDSGIEIEVKPTCTVVKYQQIGFKHVIIGDKAEKFFSFVENLYKEMTEPLLEFMNEIV